MLASCLLLLNVIAFVRRDRLLFTDFFTVPDSYHLLRIFLSSSRERSCVRQMAGIMGRKDIVAFGLCVVVVMASLAAETDAATCNLDSLMP